MENWIIKPLDLGFEDLSNNAGLAATLPYLGFYLTNGKQKILVDNGMSEHYVEYVSKLWGPCGGGEDPVRKAFDENKIKLSDIDLVIYTHLHFDHVGNCHLFPKAIHVFQLDDLKEMIDPTPSAEYYCVFDKEVIGKFKKLKCERVCGDIEISKGLKLFHTPGHSKGSQCVMVSTINGDYLLAGDLFHFNLFAFPEINVWTQYHEGRTIEIDKEFKEWLFSSLWKVIFDHYTWYRSQYRMKPMLQGREFLLGGHEPSVLRKTFGI